MNNPDTYDKSDQARELVGLCREGRLYEIEKWIADGKSLDISAARKRGRHKSLLQLAVETGFHSLVELIAKQDASVSSKNAALADSVSTRRLDLVELLVANGAEIKSVPLSDVLLSWEPPMIRFFLEHGADAVEDRPFAIAFGERVRTALRVFVDYKKANPQLATQLQGQVDCALRHFCGQGDLKWVNLLMWAGADPRSRGPCLHKEYTEDPECFTSGLEEACHSDNPDVLKKLKPDPNCDNLSDLLNQASFWPRKGIVEYLLQVGAKPNDKPGGGSSALDAALRNLHFASVSQYGGNRLKSRYDVSRSLDCVRELLAHGAIWDPDEKYELASLRRSLLECQPEVTIELLRLFRAHDACPAERVHKLLGTPRMKEHLSSEINALLRLGIHLDPRRNSAAKKPDMSCRRR